MKIFVAILRILRTDLSAGQSYTEFLSMVRALKRVRASEDCRKILKLKKIATTPGKEIVETADNDICPKGRKRHVFICHED